VVRLCGAPDLSAVIIGLIVLCAGNVSVADDAARLDQDVVKSFRACDSPVGAAEIGRCQRLKAIARSGLLSAAGGGLSYASRRPETGFTMQSAALGLTVSEITGDLAKEYRVTQSIGGVIVTSVEMNGFASRRGLEAGDVLVEIDQNEIGDPAALFERLDSIAMGNDESALLLIYRRYEHLFQVVSSD
jgi:S1-C subfamily serine protease